MYIAYYRVSTQAQGRSGLGLEAQRAAVTSYLSGGPPLAHYTDVESGARDDRPQLVAALNHCRLTGATLLVAKLDRLSRNVAFLAQLQAGAVAFKCVDMPEATELTIHILAAVAQAERKMISTRVREALQAAKARGRQLGGDRGNLAHVSSMGRAKSAEVRRARAAERRALIMPHLDAGRAEGHTTLAALAGYLNARSILTARGGSWHPASVARLLG